MPRRGNCADHNAQSEYVAQSCHRCQQSEAENEREQRRSVNRCCRSTQVEVIGHGYSRMSTENCARSCTLRHYNKPLSAHLLSYCSDTDNDIRSVCDLLFVVHCILDVNVIYLYDVLVDVILKHHSLLTVSDSVTIEKNISRMTFKSLM